MSYRVKLVLMIAATITLGVLSRVVVTGWVVIDKYLGDALYAVLIYLLLRLVNPKAAIIRTLVISSLIVLAIECFQLTLIPLRLSQSTHVLDRLLAIVLGTEFSWLDICAYVVGLAGIGMLDHDARQQSPN